MADNDLIEQIGKRVEYLSGLTITTATFIGTDSAISAKASQNVVGANYNNDTTSKIRSSVTEKLQSDRSKWTVVYGTSPNSGGSGDDDYISQTWTMAMTQYEYPLEKYLSADAAGQVAAWEQTDMEHKKAFSYVKGMSQTGPVYESLQGRALDVAKKKFAGIETVLKFYPQASRVTVYSSKRDLESRAKKLNHVDTTPGSEFGSLSAMWLKSGFDWTQNNDATWTLTESWIGAPYWDKDLYSSNSGWEFYEPAGGQGEQH